jgi:hypothetical protein
VNLRLSLLFVIIASWVAVIAVYVVDTGFGEEDRVQEPPYFYNLPETDIRSISLETEGQSQSFFYDEETRRWFIEGMDRIPADLFRWGGITVLLGGPRTQRVLSSEFDDAATYGLDNPSSTYTVGLRDGTERVLKIGNKTVSGESTYAQVEGFPQLVLVDTSWSDVLDRLVTEPPIPEWLYTLDTTEVRELLLFKENEIVRAYGRDRETGEFHLCDLPVQQDPCTGTVPVDPEDFQAALDLIADHRIQGAVSLNLEEQEDFQPYGAGVNSPYFAIRLERKAENNVTEVHRLTMTIGDVTPDGASRYAVANETSDVIRVEKEWADILLQLFEGDPLVAGS